MLNILLILNNKKKVLFFYKNKVKPSKLFVKLNIQNFNNETKCNNFIMFASNEYLNKMLPWKNTKSQRDFMLNYNCSNYFIFNDFFYLYI